jgi:hypothetical protein
MQKTYGRDLDLNLLRVFAVVADDACRPRDTRACRCA